MLVILFRILFFIALIGVAWLSLDPTPDVSDGPSLTKTISTILLGTPDHSDKVGHFIAYFVLGGLAAFSFRPTPASLAGLFVFLIVFGGCLEFGQSLTPGRHADLVDAGANAAGTFWGLLVGLSFRAMTKIVR